MPACADAHTPPGAPATPIPFIVGSGRSGTTLLRLMLDSHPHLAIPPETQFLDQLARACRTAPTAQQGEVFLRTLTAFPRWPDFHLEEAALARRVRALRPFDLSAALRAFYGLYAERFGKPRWGDHTPLYAAHVHLIRQLFPEAHFIHLIRDGRDVVLSYREVWFGPPTLEATIQRWLERVDGAQQARRYEHYLEMRYEDLVSQPEAALRRVCDFLALPWRPEMLEYDRRAAERMAELYREYPARGGALLISPDERLATHRLLSQRPDPGRIGRWRSEMAYADLVLVEEIAGDRLRALGYELVTRGTLRAQGYRAARLAGRPVVRAWRFVRALAGALRAAPLGWREPLREARRKVRELARRLLSLLARLRFAPSPGGLRVTRFSQNPILHPGLSPSLGDNLNGPSLICAPAWLSQPLGRYYLYFSHHRGDFIRLATAHHLEGPWTVHEPGVLRLAQTPGVDHLASPDVHIDSEARVVRMYFHCPVPPQSAQMTFVAVSEDAIHFSPRPEPLGPSYFRVFRWDGFYYALARAGALFRSRDGLARFEAGPNPFPTGRVALTVRHAAVQVEGGTLRVFYSLIGDRPERILLSTINLRRDWTKWRASRPRLVLAPEMDYEGVFLPLRASRPGAAPGRVRQLRDPAIFVEAGRTYLLYAAAGESGIAIAEIDPDETSRP